MEEYTAEEFIFDFLSDLLDNYKFSDEDEETFRGVLQYIALMVPRDEDGMAMPMQESVQRKDEPKGSGQDCAGDVTAKKHKTS